MFNPFLALHQDQTYHHFADPVGSFWSNAAFLAVAAVGLLHWKALTTARRVANLGCLLVAFGSAWYHAAPSDAALLWDRLPMTIVFAAVLTEALASFRSERLRWLLWPFTTLGLASVLWWHFTGDLRPYALVQFGPLLAIPVLLRGKPNTHHWWALLAWYGVAKALEFADMAIFHWTGGVIGGHTLKHVAAAIGLGIWNGYRPSPQPKNSREAQPSQRPASQIDPNPTLVFARHRATLSQR